MKISNLSIIAGELRRDRTPRPAVGGGDRQVRDAVLIDWFLVPVDGGAELNPEVAPVPELAHRHFRPMFGPTQSLCNCLTLGKR